MPGLFTRAGRKSMHFVTAPYAPARCRWSSKNCSQFAREFRSIRVWKRPVFQWSHGSITCTGFTVLFPFQVKNILVWSLPMSPGGGTAHHSTSLWRCLSECPHLSSLHSGLRFSPFPEPRHWGAVPKGWFLQLYKALCLFVSWWLLPVLKDLSQLCCSTKDEVNRQLTTVHFKKAWIF